MINLYNLDIYIITHSSYLTRRRYEHEQLTRDNNNDNMGVSNESLPFAHVAFVGDAAHTLDPILAQGMVLLRPNPLSYSHFLVAITISLHPLFFNDLLIPHH